MTLNLGPPEVMLFWTNVILLFMSFSLGSIADKLSDIKKLLEKKR